MGRTTILSKLQGLYIENDEYYEGTGGNVETHEIWQNVKRGYRLERLLGPTKKDKGKQPGGEDRSFIINIEGLRLPTGHLWALLL
jgi:hypothetical protein